MKVRKILILLAYAFVGWALCGAVMGIGMATMSIDTALMVHAIAAPIIFFVLSLVYMKYANVAGPLPTAIFFIVFVMLMDFLVVALLIIKSLQMFTSLLGTWIPFMLIFDSTFLTLAYGGSIVERKEQDEAA